MPVQHSQEARDIREQYQDGMLSYDEALDKLLDLGYDAAKADRWLVIGK